MSTIVYRDGVMAADSRAYSGHATPIGSKMKIRKLKDGGLIGVSSARPGQGEVFMSWVDRGADPDEHLFENLDITAIWVKPNGDVFYFYDSLYPSGPLTGSYFAIGSGDHYALGACRMGADAIQAAEIGAELDTVSGLPVFALELGNG